MELSKLLRIDYPIIQGGMAHIATGAFAAAVSQAGALGMIGAGGFSAEELKEEILEAQSLTDKPFGVNLMLLHPQIEEQAKLVTEMGVNLITTGAGNPGRFVEAWKDKGIKVFPVVGDPALGQRMARLGVDGLIAEGSEAGGHIGPMTTMTLIPQLRERTDLPLIAAGGIASGSQLLAAEALGAIGVQMGTAFLATEECPIHEDYKNRVLRASSSHSKVIGQIVGLPLRTLNNSMVRNYLEMESKGASKEELEHYTLGALRRAVHKGDISEGSLMAGLVVGQINKLLSVEELLEGLYQDYLVEKKRLCFDYKG